MLRDVVGLYKLSARDEASPLLLPLGRIIRNSGTASALTVRYTVPLDQALILSLISLEATPTGGEFVNQYFVTLLDRTLALNSILFGAFNPNNFGVASEDQAQPTSAAAVWRYTKAFDTIIPGGSSIDASINKNAAVASMGIGMSIYGVLIPIGNLGRL